MFSLITVLPFILATALLLIYTAPPALVAVLFFITESPLISTTALFPTAYTAPPYTAVLFSIVALEIFTFAFAAATIAPPLADGR